MKRLWTFAFLIFSGWPIPLVQAQHDLSFEHIELPGGSTPNFVNDVAQDSDGFLWLATRAWLIKYDGYETTAYRHNPQDTTSLAASNWVESVYVDRAGTLWVGTHGGGLDRFHSENETFSHFAHDPTDPTSLSGDTVTVMLEDRDGIFWVGTHQGLNRMDRETGTCTRFRHDPVDTTSLSNDQVRTLYEDSQGTLWIGTGSPWGSESPPGGGGLNRFDPDTETFTHYLFDRADPESLIGSHVMALFEDSRGTFWVGTSGDGLHSMDRTTGAFTRHLYDPTDPGRLSMPHVDEFTGPSYVSVVHEDRTGALWIGAINGGLSRYDPTTDRLVQYEDDPDSPSGFGSTFVSGMFESGDGVQWVVTWDGLFKIVQRRNALRHHVLENLASGGSKLVTAFLEDEAGTFWVGAEAGGLSRFDDGERPAGGSSEPTVRYLHVPGDPHSLSDDNVLSLHPGREGDIWVGTSAGLNRLDPQTGRFTRYLYDPGDPHSLGPGPVSSLSLDDRGVLWAGIYGGGLSRLDPETDRFTRYLHDPEHLNSLSDNDVVAIHEDPDGMLWIGTLRGGINRLDPHNGRFTRYPYPVNDSTGLNDGFITSIYESEGGTLWIGTHNGGLNRLEPTTGHFTHFTTANSTLPDDRVNGILGDAEGHLWMSTGIGSGSRLTRFAPEQNTFYIYDLDLVFASGTTIPGAYQRTPDELFFGGNDGFIAFSPEEVVRTTPPNPHPPQIALTGLRLFDRPVEPGPDSPLKAVLSETEAVRLAHDQNTFSFEFVGLHFDDPAENRYAYMLEGYDDTWRTGGDQRQAGYYKVPPGQYTFRAKAANSDGIWNDVGAAVTLTVLPPWWRTAWAYFGYALLLLGGMFAAALVQRRHLLEVEGRRAAGREAKLRADLAEERSQVLEALDQTKSRFFANISHEFRTPLTLVLGPLRDVIDGQIDAHRLAATAPLMHRNASRLLHLINQLLDLSRLDADGMHLHSQREDVVAFLRRHVLTFTSRVERDGVALVFAADPDEIEMDFDPEKLQTIITNLLSNAFKFTPSGGRIRVMIQLGGDDLVITVRDTGEGILPDHLPHVFDRFYQAETMPMHGNVGTGIGLALARELVELHGGTIGVESERGFGSTFTIRLPRYQQGEVAIPSSARQRDRRVEEKFEKYDDETHALEEADESVTLPALTAPSSAPQILIVEDHDDMRTYLRSHLCGTYRLLEAEDGAEGLRLAREHQPDLVISDVMMPGIDGFALCEAIKSDEKIGHIPVVLLTARADEVSRIEGLQTGADAYLAKPFSFDELMTRVENLVEIRRRLRERFSDAVRLGPGTIVVTSADAAFVERVRHAIETEMADSTFGVGQLAAAVGMSERQLHRRIKDTAGLTPAAYIRMMRLERAAQLVEQQAGRVSDIAYAVGFNSPKYFARLYKQTFGHAPSDDAGANLN